MPDDDIDFTAFIGNVIKLPHIEDPTHEDVDKYHAIYKHIGIYLIIIKKIMQQMAKMQYWKYYKFYKYYSVINCYSII